MDGEVSERALEGLSLIWIRFPELLYRSQEFIQQALGNTETHFSKIKILETFRAFFSGIETRMIENKDEDSGQMLGITHLYVDKLITLALDGDQEVRKIGVDVLREI
jgi:hypothetical protein